MSDFDDFHATFAPSVTEHQSSQSSLSDTSATSLSPPSASKKSSRRTRPKPTLVATPLPNDDRIDESLPPFEGFTGNGGGSAAAHEDPPSEEWTDEEEEYIAAAASKPQVIPRVASSGGASGGFYSSSYPSSSNSPPPGFFGESGSSVPSATAALMNHPSIQTLVSSARMSLDYSKLAMDGAAGLASRGGAAFMEDVMPILRAATSAAAATSAEAIALGVPRVTQALSTAQVHLQTSTLPACVQQAKAVQRWLQARVHLSLPPPTIAPTSQGEKEELGGYIDYIEKALKQQDEVAEARMIAAKKAAAANLPQPSGDASAASGTTYLSGQSVIVIDDHFSVLTHKEKAKLEGFLNDWKKVRSQAVLIEGNDRVTQELKTRFEAKGINQELSSQQQPSVIQGQQFSGDTTGFAPFAGQALQQSPFPTGTFLGGSPAPSGFVQGSNVSQPGFRHPSAAGQPSPDFFAGASGVPSSSQQQYHCAPQPAIQMSPFLAPQPMPMPGQTFQHHHQSSSSPFAPQPSNAFYAQPMQPAAQQSPQMQPFRGPDGGNGGGSPAFMPQLASSLGSYPSQSPPAVHNATASVGNAGPFVAATMLAAGLSGGVPGASTQYFPGMVGNLGAEGGAFVNSYDGGLLPSLDSLTLMHPSFGLGFGGGDGGSASSSMQGSYPSHITASMSNSSDALLSSLSNLASPQPSLQTVSRNSSTSTVHLGAGDEGQQSPSGSGFIPGATQTVQPSSTVATTIASPPTASFSGVDFLSALKSKSDKLASKSPEESKSDSIVSSDTSSSVPLAPPLIGSDDVPPAPPMAPDAPPPPPGAPGIYPTPSIDLPPTLKHPKPSVPLKHVHWTKLKHHDVAGTVFEDILDGKPITQVATEGTNQPADSPLSPLAHHHSSASISGQPASSPQAPNTSDTPILPVPSSSNLPQSLASIDIDLNVQDLEAKFYSGTRKKDPKDAVEGKKGGKKKDDATQTLELPSGIDQLRAQNAEISLSRLKMQPEQIRDYLWLRVTRPPTLTGASVSSTPESTNPLVHSADLLDILMKVCPTEEETLIMQKTKRTPEQLPRRHIVETCFQTLIEVPRVKRRVELLFFRLDAPSIVRDLAGSITLIEQASTELKRSHSLRYVLKLVLTTGNILNHATSNLGCAWGFKLTFLRSISATKSSEGSMTLMHWMIEEIGQQRAKFLLKQAAAVGAEISNDTDEAAAASIVNEGPLTAAAAPPEVLQLLTELEHIPQAAAGRWKDMLDSAALSASLQSMKAKLASIASEIKIVSSKNASATTTDAQEDGFPAFMNEFLIDMQQQYNALQTRFDDAVKACDDLARYFAESEPLKLESLFQIFADFLSSYKSAEIDIQNKKKTLQQQEARKATQAALAHAKGASATATQAKRNAAGDMNEVKSEEIAAGTSSSTSSTAVAAPVEGGFDASELSALIAAAIGDADASTSSLTSSMVVTSQPITINVGQATSRSSSVSSIEGLDSSVPVISSATTTPILTPHGTRSSTHALTTSTSSSSKRGKKSGKGSKIAIKPLE